MKKPLEIDTSEDAMEGRKLISFWHSTKKRTSSASRGFWLLLKETIKKFSYDKAWQKSAALAFFIILSLAPTLVIVVKVVDSLYDPEIARVEIVYELRSVVGEEPARFVETLMGDVEDRTKGSSIPTLLFIFTLFLGATSFFSNLKHAMNHAWGADPETTVGIMNFFRTRLLSFLLITILSFVIIFVLIGDAVITLGSRLLDGIPAGNLSKILHFVMSIATARLIFRFAVITAVIAFIYKVLPDAFITWRDALIGAAVTALLMSLGQVGIGFYLNSTTTLNAYGAASSLMVLLVWLYYTALVFFYGVEFTYVFAQHYGTPITPQESPLILRARKTVWRLRETNRQG